MNINLSGYYLYRFPAWQLLDLQYHNNKKHQTTSFWCPSACAQQGSCKHKGFLSVNSIVFPGDSPKTSPAWAEISNAAGKSHHVTAPTYTVFNSHQSFTNDLLFIKKRWRKKNKALASYQRKKKNKQTKKRWRIHCRSKRVASSTPGSPGIGKAVECRKAKMNFETGVFRVIQEIYEKLWPWSLDGKF